jgi:hypothetical protein
MIPFLAALSIAEIASFKDVPAVSVFFSVTASSTFLDRVFSMFLTDLFFNVRGSFCRTLLRADLLLFGADFAGNVIPPYNYNLHLLRIQAGN